MAILKILPLCNNLSINGCFVGRLCFKIDVTVHIVCHFKGENL